MKKILCALACLGASVSAMAASQSGWCGYNDYYHISAYSDSRLYVLAAYPDYRLNTLIVGPRSFTISDTGECHAGYARVLIALDEQRSCALDIKDGPFMFRPNISATCNGMHYDGYEHDGFLSYSYSLKFSV